MDIEELLEQILYNEPTEPNNFRIEFEEQIELKDLFQLLLQFFTDICKTYYGNNEGIVNIDKLTKDDIEFVNKYFASIGFKFNLLVYQDITNVSSNILDYLRNNTYDKIKIDSKTKLKDLFFILNKDLKLYKISFEILNME